MLVYEPRKFNNEGENDPLILRQYYDNEGRSPRDYFTQYLDVHTTEDEDIGESVDDVLDIVNIRAKELREFYGLTIADLSRAFKIDRKTYYRIETEGWNFDRRSLYKLCLFYEVSVDFLLGFSEEPGLYALRPIDKMSARQLITTTAQTLWEQKNPDKV